MRMNMVKETEILELEPKTEFKEIGRKFYTVFKRNFTPQKTPPKNITRLEEKVLILIQDNNKITRKIISEKLCISENVVKEYIKRLKDKNFLIRIGGAKGGY